MVYIKQLDSLRAIAILLVVICHWYTPPLQSTLSEWNDLNGALGVDIFFVLSGFLITRILLEQKNNPSSEHLTTKELIKRFYIRRALRIFPIYFIFVFCIILFQHYTLGYSKPEIFYYLTYTSNFYHFFEEPFSMSAEHLWSLAVEEQFYLIWPLLLFFTNKSKILIAIVCFIIAGIASQYLLHNISNYRFITICCFDAFGAGGLLAWLVINKPILLNKSEKTIMYVALAAFLFIVFGMLFPNLNVIPLRVKNTCIAFYLILFLYQNQNNRSAGFRSFFNNPVLIYIGKISYGIYLFHVSIPYIWRYVPDVITNQVPHFLLHEGIWILNSILLLLLASASYYCIEKPFLKLKKYYN